MSADLDISVVEQSIDVALATLSVEVEAAGPPEPADIEVVEASIALLLATASIEVALL